MADTDSIETWRHATPMRSPLTNVLRHLRPEPYEKKIPNAAAKNCDWQDHTMSRQRIIRGDEITGVTHQRRNLCLTFPCHARFQVHAILGVRPPDWRKGETRIPRVAWTRKQSDRPTLKKDKCPTVEEAACLSKAPPVEASTAKASVNAHERFDR